MYCRHCGHTLEADARFCSACGKDVGQASTTTAIGAAAVATAAAVPAPTIVTATPTIVSATAPPVSATPAVHAAKRRRTAGIILIAALALISGVLFVMGGSLYIAESYVVGLATANPLVHMAGMLMPAVNTTADATSQDLQLGGLVAIVLGIGYFVVAVNLLRLREKSGRIFGIIFAVIIALHSAYQISTGEGSPAWHVISIAFNAWVVFYLLKARIRANFEDPQPARTVAAI